MESEVREVIRRMRRLQVLRDAAVGRGDYEQALVIGRSLEADCDYAEALQRREQLLSREGDAR